jgi:hypothetical protein
VSIFCCTAVSHLFIKQALARPDNKAEKAASASESPSLRPLSFSLSYISLFLSHFSKFYAFKEEETHALVVDRMNV